MFSYLVNSLLRGWTTFGLWHKGIGWHIGIEGFEAKVLGPRPKYKTLVDKA